MNKLLICLCLAAAFLSGCKSSQRDNALKTHEDLPADCIGIYVGVLPCKNCDGIETTLTLLANRRFSLRHHYRLSPEQGWATRIRNGVWERFGNRIELFPETTTADNPRLCFGSEEAGELWVFDRFCAPIQGNLGGILLRLSPSAHPVVSSHANPTHPRES